MPCPTDIPRAPRRRPSGLAAGLALTLLAAACVQTPPIPPAPQPGNAAPAPAAPPVQSPLPPAPPPAPSPDAALLRLLAFHDAMAVLTPAELAREQARLAATPGSDATLKLAWLLAQGRNPGDLARASALLEALARGDAPDAMLARLLQARLVEQRRLEDQLERQAQQQRDLQRRNEQLREQLEALRAIERSLAPRAPASAPRSP
jgi:hypothetical protein